MFQFDRSLDTPDLDFLMLAFEKSGDCIAMLGADGTVLVVNVAGACAMGFEKQATLIGRNWRDLWHESDREFARRSLERAARGHRARFSGSIASDNGEQTWWDSTISSVLGVDDKPSRLLAISRNVTEQHQAGQALERAVRLQQALIEATSEIVWHVDVTTGISDRIGYVAFTGEEDPAEMDGWLVAIHPDDKEKAKAAADNAVSARIPLTIEYRLRHKSGIWRWVEDHATPLLDENGVLTDWVGIITDVHDRKCAETALQKSAEHLRLAVEATGLGTWDVNVVANERDWSPEFYDLLRLPRDVAPDRRIFEAAIHPEDRQRVERELAGSADASGVTQVCVFRFLDAPESERWIEAHERTFFDKESRPIRRVGTIQDITDRKRAERQVWLAAHTDALTGLANRALFQIRLDEAVANVGSGQACVGLILVDLDRFKDVNDTLGHDAGDTLLRTVAERLTRRAGPVATVARLGGDEFGVIVPLAGGISGVELLAAELCTGLKAPLDYEGREVDSAASVGWSVCPAHDPDPSSLLKNADVALYAAKTAGRGRAKGFSLAMREEMDRRVGILRSAKEALLQDQIVPYYQPKLSLVTGEIAGFEALLRWADGTQLRAPAALQDALADPELSVRLGSRMLERITGEMRNWNSAGVPFGHVALNVAPSEFVGQNYAEHIFDALERADLQPRQIEIEITERVLLDDDSLAIGSALKALFDAGVQIALDDFGTGFASLTHLTKFPVAWVKIDRSFIQTIESDRKTEAIVRAVIGLAHDIGIRVVAEGIECFGQLNLLRAAGCDLAQGFLIAKPMVGSRVPAFLRSWYWPAENGDLTIDASYQREVKGQARKRA